MWPKALPARLRRPRLRWARARAIEQRAAQLAARQRDGVRLLGHDHGKLRSRAGRARRSTFGDLLLFGVGAVIAFGGLEGLLSRGFRSPLDSGEDQVITLATALSFISIAVAICAARGAAEVIGGPAPWLAGALSASLVFALVESLEFLLAQWVQERRGRAQED